MEPQRCIMGPHDTAHHHRHPPSSQPRIVTYIPKRQVSKKKISPNTSCRFFAVRIVTLAPETTKKYHSPWQRSRTICSSPVSHFHMSICLNAHHRTLDISQAHPVRSERLRQSLGNIYIAQPEFGFDIYVSLFLRYIAIQSHVLDCTL